MKVRGQAKLLRILSRILSKLGVSGEGPAACIAWEGGVHENEATDRWTVTKGWSVASTQAGGRDVKAAARLARFCQKRVVAALTMLGAES